MARTLQEILMSGPVDKQVLAAYVKTYPSYEKYFVTPQALMGSIDALSRQNHDTSSDAFKHDVPLLKRALGDIYGINDYTPHGFLKWDEAAKDWINPRP